MSRFLLGQLLGAVIAGVVGILTQKYALHLQQQRKERQWKSRLDRLCDRLITDLPDDPADEEIRLPLYTYIDVLPLLESHLSKAPIELSDSVEDAYEDIYWYKRHYGTRNHVSGSSNDADHIESISEDARRLKSEVSDSIGEDDS
ncbi:hypothetical protein [Halobaculum sp. EA56]|uniref:hypothetical protein n=1 Tax=Halobaculum sp. EA56 TaxID=3421648 RepID=UPI003EC07729